MGTLGNFNNHLLVISDKNHNFFPLPNEKSGKFSSESPEDAQAMTQQKQTNQPV